MFKIGEFSKLVQVPVPTLRYYDQVGLLKPVEVDRFTGYRYYSANQLPRLHRILALKGLGLSLEQIGAVLDEGLTLEQMRGMLRLRHAQITQQLAEVQNQLVEVEVQTIPPMSPRFNIQSKKSPVATKSPMKMFRCTQRRNV